MCNYLGRGALQRVRTGWNSRRNYTFLKMFSDSFFFFFFLSSFLFFVFKLICCSWRRLVWGDYKSNASWCIRETQFSLIILTLTLEHSAIWRRENGPPLPGSDWPRPLAVSGKGTLLFRLAVLLWQASMRLCLWRKIKANCIISVYHTVLGMKRKKHTVYS